MGATKSVDNPWVSKKLLAVAVERADTAEHALRRLLNFIDPDLLSRHGNDYLPAVEELVEHP